MKDAGRQNGIGCAEGHALDQMLQSPNAPRRDDRDRDGFSHCTGERQIKSGPSAIAIHAGEQNLTCTALGRFNRPLHCVAPCASPPAMGVDLPAPGGVLAGIDRHDNAL